MQARTGESAFSQRWVLMLLLSSPLLVHSRIERLRTPGCDDPCYDDGHWLGSGIRRQTVPSISRPPTRARMPVLILQAKPSWAVHKAMNNVFVRLTGLRPNTVYHFVVQDKMNATSKRYTFRTAPDKLRESGCQLSLGAIAATIV
ncbi:MAG: fibronectin type III domain-containing protein [Saprospiraceae bacterium]